MSAQPTQADLLREWIDVKLDGDSKFYSIPANVRQDKIDFVKAYPELKTNENKIKPAHNRIVTERLKAKGINPKDGKITRKKIPKFQSSDSDMDSTIDPQRQGGDRQLTNQQVDGKQEYNKFRPLGSNEQNSQNASSQPPNNFVSNFDEQGVSASLNAFYLFLKWQYPSLELLTPQEKESLGKMWLPAFQQYLTEKWAMIGIPLFATLGMVMPKVAKARAEKKIEDAKKEKPDKKKKDSKKDDGENKNEDE